MANPHRDDLSGAEAQWVVRPDGRSLRALAHPLRVQMLGLLRADGPATASQLALRTGQSSGSTSYHLRQLEAAGFVAEATDRGNARDRWWRAVHRSTAFDLPPDSDEETKAVGEEYLRAVAYTYAHKLDASIAALPTLDADLGQGWSQGFTMSDYSLRLTLEEALELAAELEQIATRYRHDHPDHPADAAEGAQRVVLQFQVMPVVSRPSDPPSGGRS
jgi:DNA-binding transcriptional ArsR family regulator